MRYLSLFLLFALTLACGDTPTKVADSMPPQTDGPPSSPDAPEEVACAANPTGVDSLSDILALLPGSWGAHGVITSDRPRTAYLKATADMVFDATDIPASVLPSECQFCTEVTLATDYRIDGLTVQLNQSTQRAEARIDKGAIFRVRLSYMIEGINGVEYATLYFESGCTKDCAFNETRCDKDDTCYGKGSGYCTSCDGLPTLQCQCVDDSQQPKPDGADCLYIVTDIAYNGQCNSGVCQCNDPNC